MLTKAAHVCVFFIEAESMESAFSDFTYSGLLETCPSFSPFRFRFRRHVGTVFKTLYPKVAENEIEKVRKKDTFPTIRYNKQH